MAATLLALVRRQDDWLIGLHLADVPADGCISKAPCGGEMAGPSPADRGKQGLKGSTLTDAAGVALHSVPAGAKRHHVPLLGPALAGLDALSPPPPAIPVHLDRGYAGTPTRALLRALDLTGEIARADVPAPSRAGSCGSSSGPGRS